MPLAARGPPAAALPQWVLQGGSARTSAGAAAALRSVGGRPSAHPQWTAHSCTGVVSLDESADRPARHGGLSAPTRAQRDGPSARPAGPNRRQPPGKLHPRPHRSAAKNKETVSAP